MNYICHICEKTPNSHSFSKIGEENNIAIFYTCPSKAIKYYDCDGILAHYNGILNEHNGKPWIWHFDCEKFTIKHAMEINTALGISDLLVEKYGFSLKKIVIINKTWHIDLVIKIVWPFLNDHIRSLIKYM